MQSKKEMPLEHKPILTINKLLISAYSIRNRFDIYL